MLLACPIHSSPRHGAGSWQDDLAAACHSLPMMQTKKCIWLPASLASASHLSSCIFNPFQISLSRNPATQTERDCGTSLNIPFTSIFVSTSDYTQDLTIHSIPLSLSRRQVRCHPRLARRPPIVMLSRPCQNVSLSCIWVCLSLFLSFPLFTHCLSPLVCTDPTPRAALVTLAREDDLPAVLSSMSQLEDTFNYRYRYDWVFFSTDPLSDRFRSLTSNVTAASCIYEVVLQQRGAEHDIDRRYLGPGNPTQTASGSLAQASSRFEESTQALRQKSRWSCGPFAKEKRLQSYDWFWRVEPGVS